MGHCSWAYVNDRERKYHDTEWGVPVHDDRHMFEHLTLENLQCGLSWDLMLKKREIFRQCFDHFDYDKTAAYTEEDVQRILNTRSSLSSTTQSAIRKYGQNSAASAITCGHIQMGRPSFMTATPRGGCR